MTTPVIFDWVLSTYTYNVFDKNETKLTVASQRVLKELSVA